ncbi:hypothetical protein ACH4SP_03675 [Streptomyces sp. NPDC021093]|uniref:hypothetical protein n=1 Tax=Streptomyces sp. NPDC021093 TaxID=3365112 RepID=UPI0037B0FF7D
MNTDQLDRALRSAGVDPAGYALHPIGSGVEPGGFLLPPGGHVEGPPGPYDLRGGLALVGSTTAWWVFGGDDVDIAFGHTTTLGTYGSEAEACEVFYRELTRPDGAAFAEAKAEWRAHWERERAEQDRAAALRDPRFAALREQWHSLWSVREERGEPAMTAAELHAAFQQLGRAPQGWKLGGFDDRPLPESGVDMAAPEADGTWWFGSPIGERGAPERLHAVGLSEAEACKHIFDSVAEREFGYAWSPPTEVLRRASDAARQRGGPLPPWPPRPRG